jgi:hypothetical protein
LMAPVLKTGIPGRVSGVRIPHSPPYFKGFVAFVSSKARQRENFFRSLHWQFCPPWSETPHHGKTRLP